MILPTEEHGEDADLLPCLIDVEIEDRAIDRGVAQARQQRFTERAVKKAALRLPLAGRPKLRSSFGWG